MFIKIQPLPASKPKVQEPGVAVFFLCSKYEQRSAPAISRTEQNQEPSSLIKLHCGHSLQCKCLLSKTRLKCRFISFESKGYICFH